MSIDRLETLRSIEPMNDGRYSLHVTRPDGKNELFVGELFGHPAYDRALVIQYPKGVLRLLQITDPEIAEKVVKSSPPIRRILL